MKQCMDADNLHRRLRKIVGQVQAIDRMVDEDIPCEDILSQINAAKSALHKVGQVVLEGHIQHCVRDGITHGDPDKMGLLLPRDSVEISFDVSGFNYDNPDAVETPAPTKAAKKTDSKKSGSTNYAAVVGGVVVVIIVIAGVVVAVKKKKK